MMSIGRNHIADDRKAHDIKIMSWLPPLYIQRSYGIMIVVDELRFEWDETKHVSNKRKHDVSFEEAKSAFADGFGRLIADPDHSDAEERFVLMAMSAGLRVLIVFHCYRHGDTVRIISARKADRSERRQYEGYKNA